MNPIGMKVFQTPPRHVESQALQIKQMRDRLSAALVVKASSADIDPVATLGNHRSKILFHSLHVLRKNEWF